MKKGSGINFRQMSDAIQTLNAANAASNTVKTIKKIIGGVGVSGCDFNFATAANTTEQVIDLGTIIPAYTRILDVFTYTLETFTGATTLVAEAGTASSGHELLGSATIYAKDAVVAPADLAHQLINPGATAKHIYLSATPGANWSGVTAGKLVIYITYIDFSAI